MHWKREEKAFRMHAEEAERKGAIIVNFGWGVNSTKVWISIASKTDQGILVSDIGFAGKAAVANHRWRPYE